jgi:hypothetical protein
MKNEMKPHSVDHNETRRAALLATLIASVFIKLAIDQTIVVYLATSLTKSTVWLSICCWIIGLIAVFVAWSKA